MTKLRAVNLLSLLFVTALVTAILTVQERSRADWNALVTEAAGENVITFRLLTNAAGFPEWTPEHLRSLEGLDGVEAVFWRGGVLFSQRPDDEYVIPVVTASPGYLTARNIAFVAGRDLDETDAGRQHVVVSERIASELFTDHSVAEVVGERALLLGEVHSIVGVYEGEGSAVVTRRIPVQHFGNEYDVEAVYLRTSESVALKLVQARANAFLAEVESLAMLEAVPYREFVRPGVVYERLDYVREVTVLFRWLVIFAVLLAIINLFNQSLLSAAIRQRAWALQRVLGATRTSLVAREILLTSWVELVAVLLGASSGLALGTWLGGLVGWYPAVHGVGIGLVCLALGSVPLVTSVLRLYPYQVLQRSRGLLRGTTFAVAGSVGLALALALVVLAGGFRDLGHAALYTEVEAIGGDLVELIADRSSILPAAQPTAADLVTLRQVYDLPLTLIERYDGVLGQGDTAIEVDVIAAFGDFITVSGTRLVSGAWEEEGLVLGADVAEALSFQRDLRGQELLLRGSRIGETRLAVVAVAEPPSTERLESLQLMPNAVLVPRSALRASSLRSQLYARAGELEATELERLVAFLSARHPDKAPFRARYPAANYQSYLERLDAQVRQFSLVAVLIFVLAATGLATLAVVRAIGRLYRRGLERAFGAPRSEIFRLELWSALGLTLLVGGVGSLGGLLVLRLWTATQGYVFILPLEWLAAALLIMLCIGTGVGVGVARWSSRRPPITILREEGGV